MIIKLEMERFTVTSSTSFEDVVAAIKAAIGHPNMAEFWQSMQIATSAFEPEAVVRAALGETGRMQFVEFDHAMIVRKGTERHASRIIPM
jgi:hypothetical protein